MYDASTPPESPPGWEVVGGYIGGHTPHVWSDAEWQSQPARWRLPIFTRDQGGDPAEDADAVISWMRSHGVPKGVCVALDYEKRVDGAYLRAFDAAIVQAGWKVMVYGSESTVLNNPKPSGGYWVAHWTGNPFLHSASAATQWAGDVTLGKPWDANLVADSTPLWDTTGGLSIADVDAILKRLEVLRVGDRPGGQFDTHDFASLEGLGMKLNDTQDDITWLKAAVKAIAARTGATLPPD
jgi:hypothetical protein